MNKLFRYELRRLLCSKLFWGVLFVALGYGWLTLTGSIILGVAHTAPFSSWSFGYYLSRLLPLVCLGELLFVACFTSKKELLISPLTWATPMDQRWYLIVRCGAVLVCTFLLCLSVAALAMVFYVWLFGWVNYGELILPTLLTLLPPIVFCLGAGMMLGQLHPNMIYLLMATVFLLCVLPLPITISFSLSEFFSQFPLTLGTLDPAFYIPGWLIISKITFAVLGFILIMFAANMRERQYAQPKLSVSGISKSKKRI